MKAFFILIGSFTLLATLLPLLRTEVWWIRIFDFPRLQITLLAVAVLILYPLVWKSGSVWEALFIVLLAASTLYQIGRMLPYTPLWKKQVRESRRPSKESSLRLLIANVWMPNKNAPRLLEIIRKADPDLILILEANHWWQSELDHLEKSHPSLVHHPLENTYGMLLYSRLDWSARRSVSLFKKMFPRSILACGFRRAGKSRFISFIPGPRPRRNTPAPPNGMWSS
ncbi:MAG: hypothetical protein MPW15_08875 [Candidatus Manganitrophus sp.]|nr:hypothetical protein [Candidatus Manganitrophus sp.]